MPSPELPQDHPAQEPEMEPLLGEPRAAGALQREDSPILANLYIGMRPLQRAVPNSFLVFFASPETSTWASCKALPGVTSV